jgi:GT2 family glycosyltransferase
MPETRRRDTQKREQPVETVAIPQEPVEIPVEPRVSVILIAHNQAVALRRAIPALESSQHRDRMEIIVVDCASHDDTGQLDLEFENITLLRLPHNLGATRSMNIGIRTAKAEILFFLSPGVEVEPATVTSLADRLKNAPDASGSPVSREQNIRDALTSTQGSVITATGESVAVEYAPASALMIRKAFLKGMNFFDERFGHFGADLDLAMQIRNAQRRIRIYPNIRATYHAAPDPFADESLYSADRESGIAAWKGKYEGFMSGLMYRLGAIFAALGRFKFGDLSALLSGKKLDGSQSM